MRWTVHGERDIYDSPWVRLTVVDVEIPGTTRFDHHVVRAPREAVGTVVINSSADVLLLWRHRFITDTWGWEIPAGRVEPGEELTDAARRETLEETGWEVSSLAPLSSYYPMNGMSDQRFHLFLSRDAARRGDPEDPSESERVEWVPMDQVRQAVREGLVADGLSLTALTFALAFGLFDQV
jgi:8-oxo-dGTP pyrophosphatase MutT (NUDIX family)